MPQLSLLPLFCLHPQPTLFLFQSVYPFQLQWVTKLFLFWKPFLLQWFFQELCKENLSEKIYWEFIAVLILSWIIIWWVFWWLSNRQACRHFDSIFSSATHQNNRIRYHVDRIISLFRRWTKSICFQIIWCSWNNVRIKLIHNEGWFLWE